MLAIRMQRTGRKGHAMFRVIVQDSRLTPTSGKIVATLGNYDPHAQVFTLDKDKAAFYLEHGAQPSDRIARLLKNEGVKFLDSSLNRRGSVLRPHFLYPEEVDEKDCVAGHLSNDYGTAVCVTK